MMQMEKPVAEAGQERLSALGRALAHPARVAILGVLARRGTCICGEIVDELPLAQSTVSQHLKVLKEAGLVRGTIEGVSTCYCLDAPAVASARAALDAFFARLETAANNCCC